MVQFFREFFSNIAKILN